MTASKRSPLAKLRHAVARDLRHSDSMVRQALAPWIEGWMAYDEQSHNWSRVRDASEMPENRPDAWRKLAVRCFALAERFEALGRTAHANAQALERRERDAQ
jgi:hypothetical protein